MKEDNIWTCVNCGYSNEQHDLYCNKCGMREINKYEEKKDDNYYSTI